MSLAWLSVSALGVAIVGGMVLRLNVGLLALALAFGIGIGPGGMRASDIAAGFPVQLFLVLVAVTFLFAQAQVNGTLDKLARQSIRLARGNPGGVPIVFFFLAVAISTMGAGNIAATALLAPVAMAAGARLGVSAFLMTIMVANGANAGAFSPVAPTGIVAAELMADVGLPGLEWRTYWNTFITQSSVAFASYALFGGLRLFRSGRARHDDGSPRAADLPEPFAARQWLTLGVIAALLVSVIAFQVDVVVGAFLGAAVLTLSRAADEDAAIRAIPWHTLIMVCGVTTLVALIDKTGGIDAVVDVLVRFSTPLTVTAVIALVAGIVSAYSSSIGVVLPTFLPMTSGLAERLGADALAIASSINVGGHMVDVSPLSSLGALCIASAPAGEDKRRLFNQVLAWGLSMAVVGAVVCFLFFGLPAALKTTG
jgi:di/tricarboxylate transporter